MSDKLKGKFLLSSLVTKSLVTVFLCLVKS
jgi:hypothetical protein